MKVMIINEEQLTKDPEDLNSKKTLRQNNESSDNNDGTRYSRIENF